MRDNDVRQSKLTWTVEALCAVLTEHGIGIAVSTYYYHKSAKLSARACRDAELTTNIRKIHEDNFGVYGAAKVWRELQSQGVQVARCTVERLMKTAGLQGVRRGVVKATTIAHRDHERPLDLVDRKFTATAPNQLWVADFTYVSTAQGWVYVAFVIDVFSRRVIGWRTHTQMTTSLVLDALEHAVWQREKDGHSVAGVVHHHDMGAQYTSMLFTQRLVDLSIDASVGSVGDSYDNALAESFNGLYKTELIKRRGPWKTVAAVELATAEYIDWFNTRRIHSAIGNRAPNVVEKEYYDALMPAQPALV